MTDFHFKTLADAYREAIRLDNAGQYGAAREICQLILNQSDGHAEVYHLLGVILLHERRREDAIVPLRRALQLKPDLPDAANHLALVYRELGKWVELRALLEQAHALDPNNAVTAFDLGYAHDMLKQPAQACRWYRHALALDPQLAPAHANLAAILIRDGAFAEAARHLDAALTANPNDPFALINAAMLHDAAGRSDAAVTGYERLLRVQPQHIHAQVQRALALIAGGRLAEGWAAYTSRFNRPEARTLHAAFPVPYWKGESLDGRRLVVWTEQGPGDEILLASMLPDVLEKGVRLTLVCSSRLAPLFRRSFPDAKICDRDSLHTLDLKSFEFQASLSELGLYLRADFSSFPARRAVLIPDSAVVRELRGRYLNGKTNKLVGIAWHSANPIAEAQKSTTLEDWKPLLELPGITAVNLQYGEHRKDAAGAAIITDASVDPLKDIDRFAAQVAAMDHVVSVSNTTVHVAGGLGVPTATVIPTGFGRIWYWFLDRKDSPWYPSMTLYRQTAAGDWSSPLGNIARDLRRTLGINA